MFLLGMLVSFFLGFVIAVIQFVAGKSESWDKVSSTGFECGFSSYFNSRFSFSVHYFMVGLVFLFLDLELCVLMPFFNEGVNNAAITGLMCLFIFILLLGLIQEWSSKKLDWLN